jgi:hypothetical protein
MAGQASGASRLSGKIDGAEKRATALNDRRSHYGLAILLYFVVLVKSLVGARDPQLAAKPFAIRSARTAGSGRL